MNKVFSLWAYDAETGRVSLTVPIFTSSKGLVHQEGTWPACGHPDTPIQMPCPCFAVVIQRTCQLSTPHVSSPFSCSGFKPFRRWQQLISLACSTSVSLQDLLTLLCLPIWVTWKAAHRCVRGSPWPANPAAINIGYSCNPPPIVHSFWCFCNWNAFMLLRY